MVKVCFNQSIISSRKLLKKSYPKKGIRLFENENEITNGYLSHINCWRNGEEIRDKSDVECNFYQSAEDVPDIRELSSEKKNLMVFDHLLLENQNTCWIVLCQRKTQQRWLFPFCSKVFQAPTPNNQREREFHMSVSPRPEEP